MIARVRKSLDENQKGFTLIELLVVVIIIGILAAIAIPMFLSQREKAWEKQVVSDMKNSTTAAEAFATNNDGFYTDLDNDELVANGYRETDGVHITVEVTDGPEGTTDAAYVLTGTHDNLDATKEWSYNSNVGKIVNPGDPVPEP